MNFQEVYIIYLGAPWLKGIKARAEIRTKKMTWAIRPCGRRNLLGASAFQSEAAAVRARIALCVKIANDSYARYHRFYAWEQATKFLEAQNIAVNKIVSTK